MYFALAMCFSWWRKPASGVPVIGEKVLAAIAAAEALIALVASPLLEGDATAMRAALDVLCALLENDGAFSLAFPRLQRLLQLRILFGRQIANGRKDLFYTRLELMPRDDHGG